MGRRSRTGSPTARDVRVPMDAAESEQLRALAARWGIAEAEVVRRLVAEAATREGTREERERRFGRPKYIIGVDHGTAGGPVEVLMKAWPDGRMEIVEVSRG